MYRVVTVLSAVFMWTSAFLGMDYSDATWVSRTQTPMQIAAAPDWTPPDVSLDPLGLGVQGVVTVTAHASDAQSSITSVSIAWAPAGTSTWTTLTGCTTAGSPDETMTCSWDTSSGAVPDGDYQLQAYATNSEGYDGSSALVQTSVLNSEGMALAPVASPIRGTVTITGGIFNGGPSARTLYLEYRPSSGGPWTELDNDCQSPKKSTTLSCDWHTNAVPDGSYDLRVWGDPYEDMQTGIVVDNTAPTAAFDGLPTGVLGGTVALTAQASDTGPGVASVEFDYRRQGESTWHSCGTDSSPPYSCSLDTTRLDSGTYDLRVTATDLAGNPSTPDTATRVLDNTAAALSITAPDDGATVGGTVGLRANAQAPGGVQSLDFQVRPDGGDWRDVNGCTGLTSPYSCTWVTIGLSPGSYDLRAVMTPVYGAPLTSETRTVTVKQAFGTAVFINPNPNASPPATRGGTWTITGAAGSVGHDIEDVTVIAVPDDAPRTPIEIACTTQPIVDRMVSFACDWDTSAIVRRSFTLNVSMVQDDGVTVSAASSAPVFIDNFVPSAALSISSPVTVDPDTGTTYVGGDVSLTATADADSPIASVAVQAKPAGGSWTTACTASASPWTCDVETRVPTIPNGSYSLRAVVTLQDGTQLTSPEQSVTVVNLRGVDVQGGAGPDGQLTTGDTLTFTYSTRVTYDTIKPGFTGASTPITVGAAASNDQLTFTGTGLGHVALGADYFKKDLTLAASMTAAENASGDTVVTVTFTAPGNNSSTNAGVGGGTLTWSPDPAVTDYYRHGGCSAASVSEQGASDTDW